jgi:hypothetical protein
MAWPRVRFRLRTLFVAVAMLAVLLGFSTTVIVPWYREFRLTLAMKQTGAQIYTEPRGHYLFRQFTGDALFERAVYVHLDDPRVTDVWLAQLRSLKHVEVLSIKSPNVTDEGLVHVRHLPKLMTLNLVDTAVSDAGLRQLSESLPALRRVSRRNSGADKAQ